MANIMVVEDEQAIADLLIMNLKLVGHNAFHCDNGNDVMNCVYQKKPDLMLLDIMLPGRDGFELMKDIEPLGIPVIFLTAKERMDDKIAGLKLGADDYIIKPFATIEVLTRIETVLKRYQKNDNKFLLDDLEVRFKEHIVFLKGQEIELTTKEFDLMQVLILNKNIALSRDKLLELVWGFDFVGETRTVDVHIQKLRSKLCLEDRIKTIFKVGYRLEVPK